ncbi:hypothetical protein C8R46DRAFT_1309349 [Mycena filopes]|nr:hypothetical protein C8R46DRAFT_1309349 [Mycena filopes]
MQVALPADHARIADTQPPEPAQLASILTLPPEITHAIFRHLLPPCPLILTDGPPPPSPVLLTHVCRAWRDITLGSPALWAGVRLVEWAQAASIEQLRARAELWLGRAGEQPLAIEYLDAYVSFFIRGPMPLLRHLDIYVSKSHYNESTNNKVALTAQEVPLLRSVVLNDDAAANLSLPWAQLTSLTLTSFAYPSECVPILRQTSGLVHCRIVLVEGEAIEPGGAATPEPRELLALETLTIVDLAPGPAYVHALPRFRVPALRRLQLPARLFGGDVVRGLRSFIAEAGCTERLQSLCLGGDGEVMSVEALILEFPAIEDISLGGYDSEE